MRLFMRGTSPILVTAALSLAGLVIAIGVYLGNTSVGNRIVIDTATREPIEPRTYLAIRDDDGNGIPDWQDELFASGITIATTTEPAAEDPLHSMSSVVAGTLYGGYLTLKQQRAYSPDEGERLAFDVAANIRAPLIGTPLTVTDIHTRTNSEAATLEYRAELRTALAPMVTDDPPELEYYAEYVVTKDATVLTKLAEAAGRYRAARENMLAVAAPEDAVPEHLRALNALGVYAETLERLSLFAHDTLAAVALLKTMNESEEEMLAAFNALAQYYVRTIAQN